MNNICVKAYAKINLTLDVVARRPDGYHDLEMIMQSVDLEDRITLKEIGKGIELDSNLKGLPRDEGNIAYRAARLIKKEFNISTGIKIFIEKKIPIAGGMGGGSADCAGVLIGLNHLWDLGMKQDQLCALGKTLGADVPFCLMGGTALAKGIGDILSPIDTKGDIWLVIVKPDFGVFTKNIYKRLKIEDIRKRPDTRAMIRALRSGSLDDIAANLVNVLEEVTISMHPEIYRLKSELLEQGSLGSLMSGSGPSVYGVFRDNVSAQRAWVALKRRYDRVFILKTKSVGIEIL